jgi:signal transduction histidine kinase
MTKDEKRVQLLETVEDIAHHWRQPLNNISILTSNLKLNHQFATLSDDELIDSLNKIEKSTQFLSDILDNFKRCIKDDGDYQKINLQDSMDNILNMISVVFDGNGIKLVRDINLDDDLVVNVIPLEFTQVIMNILNNANDIFIKREIEDKTIKVVVFKQDSQAIITIEDSGGGIDKDIISKVFTPYFTTKHQSTNTGLGLHTVYKTITDDFGGKVYVENTTQGAKFFIELPLV